jgi:hypothetical protein
MSESDGIYHKSVEITTKATIHWKIPITYTPLEYMKFLESLGLGSLELATSVTNFRLEAGYDR